MQTVYLPTCRPATAHVPVRLHHARFSSKSRKILINTLGPKQNGRHFPDDIFKCIFNEDIWVSIKVSLKFVPKGRINNIPALVQIIAWRRSGEKPLSEALVVRLSTHICVIRPQWVKKINASQTYLIIYEALNWNSFWFMLFSWQHQAYIHVTRTIIYACFRFFFYIIIYPKALFCINHCASIKFSLQYSSYYLICALLSNRAGFHA